jgi:hypothetical protein
MKTRITSHPKIGVFGGRFSLDSYQEGVVVHDHEGDRDATVSVGEPGHPVKGAFLSNLKANEKLPERLGAALTEEVTVFGGDLVVQVFEGGVQLYARAVNKSWFVSHARRKVAGGGGGPGKAPARADYLWLDDGLPPGGEPWSDEHTVAWKFVGKAEGPVHAGEKAVKLTATGTQQVAADPVRPGLRVGAGDVLFAHVYLDPKAPPEEVMIQWKTPADWQRAYWGANKIGFGEDNTSGRRPMGPLPEPGKWVRLEVKAADLGIEPGTVIFGLGLTQFGGTAYWDSVGLNTPPPPGA